MCVCSLLGSAIWEGSETFTSLESRRSRFLEAGLCQSLQGKATETEVSVGVGGQGGRCHSEVMNPLSSRSSVALGHEFQASVTFSAHMIHAKQLI